MKGMLNFLEKAGLVTKDGPTRRPESERSNGGSADTAIAVERGAAGFTAWSLEQIYAHEGVQASNYPVERLLRVVDGLSAMDEATRNTTITAIDGADDSWTIDDPLADAAAKVNAITTHAERVRANLDQFEIDTKSRLDASRAGRDKVIGDIRKQIAELEALASRELARGAQEIATLEANLAAVREQVARELRDLAVVSQRMRSVATQFGAFAESEKKG